MDAQSNQFLLICIGFRSGTTISESGSYSIQYPMDETVLSMLPAIPDLFAGECNMEIRPWLDFRTGFGYFGNGPIGFEDWG